MWECFGATRRETFSAGESCQWRTKGSSVRRRPDFFDVAVDVQEGPTGIYHRRNNTKHRQDIELELTTVVYFSKFNTQFVFFSIGTSWKASDLCTSI